MRAREGAVFGTPLFFMFVPKFLERYAQQNKRNEPISSRFGSPNGGNLNWIRFLMPSTCRFGIYSDNIRAEVTLNGVEFPQLRLTQVWSSYIG